jgi:hypothetical protein
MWQHPPEPKTLKIKIKIFLCLLGELLYQNVFTTKSIFSEKPVTF